MTCQCLIAHDLLLQDLLHFYKVSITTLNPKFPTVIRTACKCQGIRDRLRSPINLLSQLKSPFLNDLTDPKENQFTNKRWQKIDELTGLKENENSMIRKLFLIR
jgi:hypothetical protein